MRRWIALTHTFAVRYTGARRAKSSGFWLPKPLPQRALRLQPPQDLGPCLYFGPAGERCDRRAVQDGFCSKHQPGAKPLVSSSKPTKVMAAAIAIIGILLPYLIDLLRELARLFPR
jgi:Family of unknown function (DUF5763)